MPVQPSNCFICKQTWYGQGAVCDACRGISPPYCPKCATYHSPVANCATFPCNFCGQVHVGVCPPLMFKYRGRRTQRPVGSRGTHHQPPPLGMCPKCHMRSLLVSKAGGACMSCKAVIHYTCRNCASANTRGVKGLDKDQFIECIDCLFIE